MKDLDPATKKKLLQGACVRHIPCIFNLTWTDMFIETIYIRLEHGPSVFIDYNQMAKWALGFTYSEEVLELLVTLDRILYSLHNHYKE